jgi:hypothetical protein
MVERGVAAAVVRTGRQAAVMTTTMLPWPARTHAYRPMTGGWHCFRQWSGNDNCKAAEQRL